MSDVSRYLVDKGTQVLLDDPILWAVGVRGEDLARQYLAESADRVGHRTARDYAAWLPGALVRRRAMANA